MGSCGGDGRYSAEKWCDGRNKGEKAEMKVVPAMNRLLRTLVRSMTVAAPKGRCVIARN
jgi:hypothetical protein